MRQLVLALWLAVAVGSQLTLALYGMLSRYLVRCRALLPPRCTAGSVCVGRPRRARPAACSGADPSNRQMAEQKHGTSCSPSVHVPMLRR